MNAQQPAVAARFEPEHNLDYAQQHAGPMPAAEARPQKCPTPLRSPLPSVREIDAALEQKYGAPGYREMSSKVGGARR
jgi:hypothetical protein